MYRRAGRLFAELKSETRPRDLVKSDVGRSAAGRRDRAHAPVAAKIVLMDEPTAAISVRQVAEVLSLIQRLRDQGIAIILISHRMPDVFSRRRSRRRAATRPESGGQSRRREFARGSDGLDHRRDRQRALAADPENPPALEAQPDGQHARYPDPIPQAERRSPGLSRAQAFWVLVAVVAACLFLSVATNSFATTNNLFNVTRNFTFVAVIALGMTIVIITGGIDLSVGSVLCLCSMILAEVMHAGYSIEIGIAASLGTALLVGAVNGVLIAYVGMPPFVVTLGMLSFSRSLAMVASNNTVVYQFGPDQDKLLYLGGGAWLFGIANPVVYMIVLALIAGFTLRWTRFGRYVFAIGGNEKAAVLTGVPVRQIKIAVYMISALSAGIAGVIETGWLGAVTTNLGAGMELQVIAAAVIGGANLAGGVGTAFGALIGSALIEVIRNSLGLLGISAFWQGAFVGAFIIIAVSFDRIRNFRQSE